MKLSAAFIGLFVTCWMIAPASGQAPAGPIPGIKPGQTVTIHRDGGEKLKGTVVRVEDGSVVVNTGKKEGVIQVPNSHIVKIGRKSRAKGALIGAAIGFAGGLALGAGLDSALSDPGESNRALRAFSGGVWIGGLSAAIGAATGAQSTVYKRP